jgi:hypothetical protein
MTYKLNYSFFNEIKTEAQAYCLGYFYARGSGRIQLNIRDIQALQTIVNLIDYTGPIRIYKTVAELNIQQTQFLKQLQNLGCVPNTKHSPLFPIIEKELMSHFIRAIYENYGQVYLVKDRYINVTIVFDESFIQPLRDYLSTHLRVKTKHYYRYSHTNTVQVMITSDSQSKIFLNWLYQDANYYLARKYNKYQEYLQKGV